MQGLFDGASRPARPSYLVQITTVSWRDLSVGPGLHRWSHALQDLYDSLIPRHLGVLLKEFAHPLLKVDRQFCILRLSRDRGGHFGERFAGQLLLDHPPSMIG